MDAPNQIQFDELSYPRSVMTPRKADLLLYIFCTVFTPHLVGFITARNVRQQIQDDIHSDCCREIIRFEIVLGTPTWISPYYERYSSEGAILSSAHDAVTDFDFFFSVFNPILPKFCQ